MMETKSDPKYVKQAEMLANRVKKQYKHLKKKFAKQNIEVFRLYDGDIPEIRAAVDWYAGHLVVAEYTRRDSTPQWLPMMGNAVAQALNVAVENLHLKERQAGHQDGKRYQRFDTTNRKIVMQERDLKFYINLWDYVDTGLFSDHRNTRMMVRERVEGKDLLNLFCYTGAFSCHGAKGGARSTTSVDRSQSTIDWARENMTLNGIPMEHNHLIQADTFDFLKETADAGQRFDLCVVDPPSFFTRRSQGDHFDIDRDHPALLRSVIHVMNPGGTIYFSTNHQDFTPHMDPLPLESHKEITQTTIPEDYQRKHKQIHRCWKLLIKK